MATRGRGCEVEVVTDPIGDDDSERVVPAATGMAWVLRLTGHRRHTAVPSLTVRC